MIKVAVCDDEILYCEWISEAIKNTFDEKGIDCNIDVYTSGSAILETVEEKQYDLIFLDIRMPEVSGFEVAKQIYAMTRGDNLVFVSCEEHLVYQSFNFRPMGFIRKTELRKELSTFLHKWYDRHGQYKDMYVEVEDNGVQVSLRPDKVVYIESKAHYVYVYTLEEKYKVRAKLAQYDYLLKRLDYVKCNTSHICNLKYVRRVERSLVTLYNDKTISISRLIGRDNVKKAFHRFLLDTY